MANNCRQSIDHIKTFTDLILPALSQYSTAIICQAIERHSSTSPYWPRKFELIELCKVIDAAQRQAERLKAAILPMPTEMSEQQCEIFDAGIKMVRDRLAADKEAKKGAKHGQ
jgi:hypothetical protein